MTSIIKEPNFSFLISTKVMLFLSSHIYWHQSLTANSLGSQRDMNRTAIQIQKIQFQFQSQFQYKFHFNLNTNSRTFLPILRRKT